jgi:hypothetical protein
VFKKFVSEALENSGWFDVTISLFGGIFTAAKKTFAANEEATQWQDVEASCGAR